MESGAADRPHVEVPPPYLDRGPPPGEACGQDVGVGNDDEGQEDPQRQQPDEGAAAAVAAVAVVTGGADQRDEEEAEHRADTCGEPEPEPEPRQLLSTKKHGQSEKA